MLESRLIFGAARPFALTYPRYPVGLRAHLKGKLYAQFVQVGAKQRFAGTGTEPRRLPVERVGDGVEQGRFARPGVAADSEQLQIVETHHGRFTKTGKPAQRQVQGSHGFALTALPPRSYLYTTSPSRRNLASFRVG